VKPKSSALSQIRGAYVIYVENQSITYKENPMKTVEKGNQWFVVPLFII
jgi:hypothetical protein